MRYSITILIILILTLVKASAQHRNTAHNTGTKKTMRIALPVMEADTKPPSITNAVPHYRIIPVSKRSILSFEFCYAEILDTSIKKCLPGITQTYDEDVPACYKTVPFQFKLNLLINF